LKVKVEAGSKFEITFCFFVFPYFTQTWVKTTQHCLKIILKAKF